MKSTVRNAAPHVVLFVFVLITLGAAKYVWDSSRLAERARFDLTVRTTIDSIEDRVAVYSNVLRAAAGLFAAAQDVTRDQFRGYVRHLQVQSRYPGIQGIGISLRVKPEMVEAVVHDLRANDVPDFDIWPDDPRPEYYPIVLLEPFDRRNRAAVGYDMFTSPTRRAAMERARDTGEPAATARVTLVQEIDNQKQPGFLLYVPIYSTTEVPETVDERRAALYGFVYAPFRSGDFLRGAISEAREVAFSVTDANELVFASGPQGSNPRRFTAQRVVEIAGRRWTILFMSMHPLAGAPLRNAMATLIAGLILSYLLFNLLRAQLAAQSAAERAAQTLRESEAQLRGASRAKDEFLATLSHELRTPMTSIMGWAQLLDEDLDRDSHLLAVQSIQKSSRAQAQLIDDLLDVSRITSGKLRIDPRPTDLANVVTTAVSAVAPAADAKGVTVEASLPQHPVRVNGDGNRLQQVFWNLISNAIKFTHSGGTVRVTLTTDGHDAVASVVDTGEGIAAEFLPHVFERFRQADSSTTRAFAGLGLGLAIVRHLSELHGGSVHAQSEGVGKGATFVVRLPLLDSGVEIGEPEPHRDDSADGALRGAKILLADDDEHVRNYVAAVFRLTGAEVRCVKSAADALRAIGESVPDILITDIGMPDMDGYALLERVRADAKTRDIPVIALTAYARSEDRDKAAQSGFEAFISKPVEPAALREAVASALANRVSP